MSDNEIASLDSFNADPSSFDHLVYLRIFEGCNLHCEHCFIPSNPKKMPLESFSRIPDQVSKFAKSGDKILLQWHGGEPTALGPDYLRNALKQIESNSSFQWIHGIQTNLMNFDLEWAEIYKEFFSSSIGVSWDPEIRLLRRNAPETNKEFEYKFWVNMEKLLSSGIQPYLVVTATKTLFKNFPIPYDFFSFLESKGIRQVHLERVTKTGYARESWDRIGLSNKEYSTQMSRWARAYQVYLRNPRNRERKVQVSPFDGLFESVRRLHRGESGGYGCLSGVCDSRFHTIDANGYKFGCTAINSESDNKNAKINGVQVINTDMLGLKRKVRQADCMNCQFKSICSSGCMATEKMDDSMECSGGFGLFKEIDRLMKKEV